MSALTFIHQALPLLPLEKWGEGYVEESGELKTVLNGVLKTVLTL